MSFELSRRQTFFVIVAVSTAGFLLWLLALGILWFIFRALGIVADFWAMTEALSTAVAAATVLGAGYVAYRELSEVSSSRHMEVADRLFDEMNSTENIEARRWIFQHLPENVEEGLASMPSEGRAAIKLALNSLDRVAFLTQADWIPDEMIMPWMNTMIIKVWAKLEPYVEFESRRRNEPDYYKNGRDLAVRCRAWRTKNLPEANITWLNDAL
jgi:hypothetical protein